MSKQCLVLNKSYLPIETISWQDAFCKIFNGNAIAVEYYNEWIRTPNDEYPMPAVIVCTEYNKIPPRMPIYSKRLVCQRDEWCCQYCGKSLSVENYSIDHIVPRSRGGHSTFENTVCCCLPCNSHKADRLPKEAGMKLRCKPTRPRVNPIKAKFQRMSLEEQWEQYVKCHL